MRHRVKSKKLNRNSNHRKALFKNLVGELVMHGEITTTHAKAKAIRPITDKLITKAKKSNLNSRRLIHSFFNKKTITNKLVDHLAPAMKGRVSGYTKITKLGNRRGDDTMMVKIAFVDDIPQPEIIEPKTKKAAHPTKAKKATKSKTSNNSK